jgi:hypothetical protein
MSRLFRSSARTLFVVPAVLVAGLALSAGSLPLGGCGGASTQDVFESNPTASSSGTSGTSGGTSGTSGGTSGTSGTSGVPDASVDSGPQCPQETEPNDTRLSANTLAPTLCGAISPNSESDFLTFMLKPTSTTMQITFTGQVELKVDVAGTSVTLGGTGNNKVPFVKGQRYTIEVKATSRANTVPWRVDLIEK